MPGTQEETALETENYPVVIHDSVIETEKNQIEDNATPVFIEEALWYEEGNVQKKLTLMIQFIFLSRSI